MALKYRCALFLAVLALLGVGGATLNSSTNIASANDRGQCNGPKHRVAHKPTDLESILKQEGPKALAKMKALARKRGWSQRDGSFKNWLKNRTIIVKSKKRITIRDYYCPRGSKTMKFWKKKTVPAGTPFIVVLPDNVSRDDVTTTKKKGFRISDKPFDLPTLAMALCANGAIAELLQNLFVREDKTEPGTTPNPPPVVTPPEGGGCQITINAPVNGTVGCNVKQVCVDSGGTWDSQKNICVPAAPPTCPSGTVGSPPNCHVPTCQELGTCHVPTCQELGNCPVENTPPKCVEYKSPQHVYPNGGFVVEVSCSDTEDGANVTVRTTVQRGNLAFISHTGTTWRYQYTGPDTVGDEVLTFTPYDTHTLGGMPLEVRFNNPVPEQRNKAAASQAELAQQA